MFSVVRVLLLGGLVGKVLGVVRELLFAWLFGTGAVASAFKLAQSAFLIPMHGFVTETINGGFTPQYAAHRKHAPAKAANLFTSTYSALLWASVLVGVVLLFSAPLWVAVLAPGFDHARRDIAISMLQILALALPAYVISGLFASVDLAMGRGQLNASRASLQSIGLILGTLLAYWLNAPIFIAIGFVLAYWVLAILGGRAVKAESLSLQPAWRMTPEIREGLGSVFKVVRVLIWIPIAFQINAVLERRVASVVSVDAVAAIDYARFITETLIILIAMPFGIAGLSTMAAMDEAAFKKALLRAFRALLYTGVPISAALCINAGPIISMIFERGAFGASSVATTAQILSGMSIGIWGQLLGYAGAKFLTARGDNRSALVANIAGVGMSIGILWFGQPYWGVNVLGLAAAVQGIVSGGFVLWRLRAAITLARELFSLMGLAALYAWASTLMAPWADQNLLLNLAAGLAYWLLVFTLLPYHRNELTHLYQMLTRKMP